MTSQPAPPPAGSPPQTVDSHRIRGAAAWRYVLTCALYGPPLGYGILAILLALGTLPFEPFAALLLPLYALFGIVYFGVGILMAYVVGAAPATVAGLLCLWWHNRNGALSRTAAAGAGLLAGVAAATIVFTAAGGWRDIDATLTRNADLSGFAFLLAVVATSVLSSVILAPVALRRARR